MGRISLTSSLPSSATPGIQGTELPPGFIPPPLTVSAAPHPPPQISGSEKMEAKKKKEKEERRKKQRDEEAAAATAAAGPREDPLMPELTENLNRQMSMEEDASGIDGAIDLLSGGGGGGGLEKHPERRQKAAYAEFEVG